MTIFELAGRTSCLALLLAVATVLAGTARAADGPSPPIFVRPVKAAPEAWDMSGRVARSLQAYRLRAETGPPDGRGYRLVGRLRPKLEGGQDLLLSWELYGPQGDQIRDFVQVTSVPFSGEAEKDAVDVLAKSVAATVAWSVAEHAAAEAKAAAKTKPAAGPAKAKPRAAPPPQQAAKPPTGLTVYWVQVGAFPDRPKAERWYGGLRQRHPAILESVPYVIIPADLGGTRGVWYRIRVGPFPDATAAGGMCRELKSKQVDCFVRKTG